MNASNTAVILAAGRGTRLGARTADQPKPMTEVNGVSIIGNLLSSLQGAGVEKVVLVTGYLSAVLEDHVCTAEGAPQVDIVENADFAATNNIYSLWCAREYLREGFMLFEADVFCEPSLVSAMVDSRQEDLIVVDRFREPMTGTVVELGEGDTVQAMHLKRDQEGLDLPSYYKTVNFYRFGADYVAACLVPGLRAHVESGDVNSYYELVVKESIADGHPFHGLTTGDIRWWEIDTVDDLRIAEELFR